MATHSSTPAWKIPWIEEPGRLQSMGSLRVGHNWETSLSFHALEKEMATHSSVLAWRIPGTGEPSRLLSTGSHRVGHNWSDLAAVCTCIHTEHVCINIIISSTGMTWRNIQLPFYTSNNARIYFLRREKLKTWNIPSQTCLIISLKEQYRAYLVAKE